MSSYASKRLWFMLLMSLGASKRLRGFWFWGCTVLLVSTVWGLYYHAIHEVQWHAALRPGQSDIHELSAFACWIGFLSSIVGYGYWIVAHVIRFFGKHVKDGYRDDKLFER